MLVEHKEIGFFCFLVFFFFFFLFWVSPMAFGGSVAWDPIRGTSACQQHRHNNIRSEVCLRPTPQLTEMPDP